MSHTLQNLDEFVLYNFYVVAHNENGAGDATEEVMARTFSDGKHLLRMLCMST